MTELGNGQTTYTYDTLNRLTNILDFNNNNFGFGYDVLSRRTQLTRPNGLNTNYGYDSVSNLLSVAHQLGASTLDGATYTYDSAGNRKSKTNLLNSAASNFSYDNIYQLTGLAGSNPESYTYDPVGNRLTSQNIASYTYNSSNELTSTSAASYTYDDDGNTRTRTDSTGTTTYNWDFENRLISVQLPNSSTVSFKYDPFGRRIQKSGTSTTNYVYDGASVTEEVDSSANVLARYSQGFGSDEPLSELRFGAVSYYEQDGLGSITSLSAIGGVLANTYIYDSFGSLSNSSGTLTNPYQYTGRDYDPETGLRYHRARYYDPTTGRFLSEDPIVFEGGINFYAYVENNAVNSADPFGLCDPSQDIKRCVEKLFGKPIDKIVIQEKIKPKDYEWGATTRKNKIIIFVPCDQFFNDPDTYLEEYYHVLEQWNTGRLSKLKYAVEYMKHGYKKNKYEIEAQTWVKQHLEDLKKCLECKQPPKEPAK